MHLITFVSVAAFVSFVGALPLAHHSHRPSASSSIKITQVKNSNFSSRSGFAAYAKAAARYGISTSATTTPSSGSSVGAVSLAAGPGSVGNDPAGSGSGVDQEYLCPVTIGGQQFQLDFDTGSADLWIAGAGISGVSNTYTPSGAALPGLSWDISYVDGSGASGDVYSETVTVGGTTVTAQAVERATQASSTFFNVGSDGLLGLSFSADNTVSPTKQNTFFANAVSQGLNPLFAANLQHDAAGEYDFGGVDTAAFSGDITYTTVDNSQASWKVATDEGDTGVMDTGTSLLLISDDAVTAYYANVPSAQFSDADGAWEFDCGETLPDFSMTFSGYKATVPGSYLTYATISDSTCYGGIQSRGNLDFSLFGDIFLKSQYVVYDMTTGSPRLGLAPKPLSSG